MYVPTKEEFLQGIEAFRVKEPRGAVYFEALERTRFNFLNRDYLVHESDPRMEGRFHRTA